MADLRIDVATAPGLASVGLSGELDLVSEQEVVAVLESIERVPPPILVMDLTNLDFIDSTGLRILASAHERAESERRVLALLRGPEQVHKVFCTAGLHRRFNFVRPCDLLPAGAAGDREPPPGAARSAGV